VSHDEWQYLMDQYTSGERMTFAEWKEKNSLTEKNVTITENDEDWLAKNGMTYEGGIYEGLD
jgi:hypothetical protein